MTDRDARLLSQRVQSILAEVRGQPVTLTTPYPYISEREDLAFEALKVYMKKRRVSVNLIGTPGTEDTIWIVKLTEQDGSRESFTTTLIGSMAEAICTAIVRHDDKLKRRIHQ